MHANFSSRQRVNVLSWRQGFYDLSEVGARGLLKLGKKAFGPSKLGKFEVVYKKNWTAILNGLKTF